MGRMLCILYGLVWVAGALLLGLTNMRERQRYARATSCGAHIVGIEVNDSGDEPRAVEVEYRTKPPKRLVRAQAQGSTRLASAAKTRVGQRVRIRYNPVKPTEVWVDGEEPERDTPMVVILLLAAVPFFLAATFA